MADKVYALRKTDAAKYLTREAFAVECEALATARGFARCEVAEFIRSLPSSGDAFTDAAEAVEQVQRHPEFGASACRDGLLYARWNTDGKEAARTQYLSMKALIEYHPWPVVHQMLDSCLSDPKMRFVSRDALELMLKHVRAHHPLAEEWMLRDHNRRHVPKDFAITSAGDRGHAEKWPEHKDEG